MAQTKKRKKNELINVCTQTFFRDNGFGKNYGLKVIPKKLDCPANIPEEIWIIVFKYLIEIERKKCERTCKTFYLIMKMKPHLISKEITDFSDFFGLQSWGTELCWNKFCSVNNRSIIDEQIPPIHLRNLTEGRDWREGRRQMEERNQMELRGFRELSNVKDLFSKFNLSGITKVTLEQNDCLLSKKLIMIREYFFK